MTNQLVTVCAYVDTQQGSRRRQSAEAVSEPGAAEAWLAEHDPEGVAFEYQVSDEQEQKRPQASDGWAAKS